MAVSVLLTFPYVPTPFVTDVSTYGHAHSSRSLAQREYASFGNR